LYQTSSSFALHRWFTGFARRVLLLGQRQLAGEADPLSITPNPGICEAPMVLKWLPFGRSGFSRGANHNHGIAMAE
jgi:hypothetical protein